MGELICDECGNHNPEGVDACELCGDPLDEERRSKKLKSLYWLVPWALLVTGVSYVAGAVAAKGVYYLWWLDGVGGVGGKISFWSIVFEPPAFAWGYTGGWLVAVLAAPWYSPKEDYDFGYNMGAAGFMDRPFSRQDDRDRAHATLGCVLLPFMLVHFTWRHIFERLAGEVDDEG